MEYGTKNGQKDFAAGSDKNECCPLCGSPYITPYEVHETAPKTVVSCIYLDGLNCGIKTRKGIVCPYYGNQEKCNYLNNPASPPTTLEDIPKKDSKVAHTLHYAAMAVEPIEIALAVLTREEMIGALKYQVIKYGGGDGRKGPGDREKFKQSEADLKEYTATGKLARYAEKAWVVTAPLSLDDAIKHAEEVSHDQACMCRDDHLNLACWLRELKDLRAMVTRPKCSYIQGCTRLGHRQYGGPCNTPNYPERCNPDDVCGHSHKDPFGVVWCDREPDTTCTSGGRCGGFTEVKATKGAQP